MNLGATQPLKRGWPLQRQQREQERTVRRRAVAFDRWASHQGLRQQDTAQHLGITPGTLARWQQRWRSNRLVAKPLGRRCRRSDTSLRNAAICLIKAAGPRTSVATVRAAHPQLARGEVQNLLARYRRIWRKDHRRLLCVLHWQRPGAVWTMDHTEPARRVDGLYRFVLNIRDLASGMQLAWLPMEDESAALADYTLETLFHQYGPPLVLKSDNGSPFIAENTHKLLQRWNVSPLFSPPRTPEYNGSVEAGNGAMKVRSNHEAARQGRPGCWSCDDLEAAQWFANHVYRPWGEHGPTRQEVWDQRLPIRAEERAAFGRALDEHREAVRLAEQSPLEETLDRVAQAKIDRVAIRLALVEQGILTFTRRSITSPLTAHFAVNIS
jgi:transposase InsO family protein